MSVVRALTVHPDGRVIDAPTVTALPILQGLVGGYLEHVPAGPDAHAYVSDSGMLDGLPANPLATLAVRMLRPGFAQPLCGVAVFLGCDHHTGEEADCPEAVAELLARLAGEAVAT